MNNNIFPCLWYDGDAKESAEFYCRIFNGKITADTPMVMNIELFGQKMMMLKWRSSFQEKCFGFVYGDLRNGR
jgi:predicted 3-demethylubiquinone-9 3-methyltransferase (glyoxalase superfamily)